jgi:acyl-CoA synthetase (AMP-forming)/AMP-acid ligase II
MPGTLENVNMYNLGDLIRVNAKHFSNKTALVCEGETRTFAQFNARVNRLIDALYASGLKKGDRLGILASNRIEFVEAYGAAEKGGFVAVPVNFRLDRNEVGYIVQNSGMSAMIAEGCHAHLVQGLSVPNTYVFAPEKSDPATYEALIATGEPVEPDCPIDPRDVAYMMYTGGTTGSPKGVLLDHYGQMANTKCMLIEVGVQPYDTLLTVMPIHHIGGKNFTTGHFQRGCTNILVPAFDPGRVLDLLLAHKVRNVLLAPIMIKMMLDHLAGKPFTGGCLNTVYYSSAPMPVSLLRQAIATFGPIFMQFYGLTESGPSGTALRKEDHLPDGSEREQKRLASAGRPMIYNEVQVVDDQDNVLPVGQVGEVRIKGEQIMQGYWKNEKATAETLRNGWIYSGDYGMIDEDGFVFVVGRKKDVIISGGENIYPREIEEVLNSHPAVKEVAVVGVPDETWGESVKAVLVLNDGARLTEAEVIDYCKEHLASYKKPKSVDFRAVLPKSSLGKILKSAIRDEFWRNRERQI